MNFALRRFVLQTRLAPVMGLALMITLSDGANQAARAGTNLAPSLVVNDTFEEWEWLPISDHMKASGRKMLQVGHALPYDHKGPLFSQARGFYLPAGRMVEGAEAWKGRSLLIAASAGRLDVGLYDRYSGLFEPGAHYRYEVALRGRGTFAFVGWVGGVDPGTGRFKWLDFPAFIAVPVTNEWKIYTGNFTIKRYDDTPYRAEKISAAIVISSNDVIYVDDFTISR